MALSDSVDFSRTARQIITDALMELRVIAADETPSAADANFGQMKLNKLLKGWQKYPNLWRLTEGSITLVASPQTYSYALSSSIPHRIISARYRDANSLDLDMDLMTRDEYYALPNKTVTGIPTSYYVDYQRAYPTLYIWQCPSAVTTETIEYTYLKKFDDIDSLDDDIEVRSEHLDMLTDNLAVSLGPGFGRVSSEAFSKIEKRAHFGLQDALDDDREDFVQFVPGRP